MNILHRRRTWRGPPLALQILALLIGGLVVAQAVTLLLTLLLPPEPPARYGIADIAAALRSPEATRNGLRREVLSAAPDTTGRGWLVSQTSQADLARLLGASADAVQLSFYTPLPFAGTVALPPAEQDNEVGAAYSPGSTQKMMRPASLLVWRDDGTAVTPDRSGGDIPRGLPQQMRSGLVQAAPGAGSPGGPFPGGPGGGFPGGFPGGGLPGGGFPGGGFPGGGIPHGGLPGGGVASGSLPGTRAPTGPSPGSPLTSSPGSAASVNTPVTPLTASTASGALSQSQVPAGPPTGAIASTPFAASGQTLSPTRFGAPALQAPDQSLPSPGSARDMPLPRATSAPSIRRTEPSQAVPAVTTQPFELATPAVTSEAPPPPSATSRTPAEPYTPSAALPPATGFQGAIDRARGLLGLGPSPFVQGDFIAALRLADGRWVVVQPAAASFLSPWQKRVALWFVLSLALVAPVGWLFARRLSRPLDRFAEAAAQLGRDPSAAIAPLDGPAEIGRAAHAFNLMQTRLRSFVDDRTAMVGAISHDLRTPLTRLRFRIEDVPDDVRDGMLQEVDEMEAMIASVLSFIRDASTQGARERLDLRTLLDDVAEDAAVIGADVPITGSQPATVEVEVMGMRRVLANLVENALKYGDHARIELSLTPQEAIAAVIDDGPGIPDDELEQVFQPFYRTAAARVSNARGSGLGLAVCRSIARAHGGDVRLCRTDTGFRAEVRVPLVYAAQYALAA